MIDAHLAGQSAAPIVEALREADISVVLASGYETPELRNLGFDAPLVRKPYLTKDLAKALEAACSPGR